MRHFLLFTILQKLRYLQKGICNPSMLLAFMADDILEVSFTMIYYIAFLFKKYINLFITSYFLTSGISI